MSTAVLTHLLQSTLFAVLIALFVQGFRSSAARVRYGLWFIASCKFLLPMSWLTMFRPSLAWQPEHPMVASTIAYAAHHVASIPIDVSPWSKAPWLLPENDTNRVWLIASIWFVGACVIALRWTATWLRVRAIAHAASPLAIRFPIPVRSSTAVREPGVFGIFKPVLLLPQGMHTQLTTTQLEAILAHEHAHVRRRDNLTAAVQMIVQMLFWFHPLVWWIGRNLLWERERACDEAVLTAGHDRGTYAETIIEICQQLTSPRAMCVAGMSGGGLAKRIEAIANARPGASGPARTCALAFGIVMIGALSALAGAPSTAAALADDKADAPLHLSQVMLRPSAGTRPEPWIGMIDGKLTLFNVPLRTLVRIGYLTGNQPIVDGPRWLDLRYDVQVSGDYPSFDPKEDHQLVSRIVRKILDEKLAVVVKRESRPLGIFVMRVAPEGLNPLALRPRAGNEDPKQRGVLTMPAIAFWLGQQMDHTVVDRTGLTESYAFTPWSTGVHWNKLTPETTAVAARKLGLQLEFVTEPVDVFAIVSVRQPVANWRS